MKSFRFLFFLGTIIFSSFSYHSSQSQILNLDSLKPDPWVDSVFNSMSITERVNQLLILKLEQNANYTLDESVSSGGVMINERNPELYTEKLSDVQQNMNLRPIVAHELENPFGLKMDSIDHFSELRILSRVTEPNLFYETGEALAKQCQNLGITTVLHGGIDLIKVFIEDSWKFLELNQGLIDNHIIPINALKVHGFEKENIVFVDQLFSWDMITILSSEVDGFHQIVQDAISNGQIEIDDLESKCKQVLARKKWLGFDKADVFTKDSNYKLQDNPVNSLLREEIAKYALVALGVSKNSIPIKQIENKKIAHLSIGSTSKSVFNEYANKYTTVDYFDTGYTSSDENYAGLWTELNSYDLIVCAYHNLDQLPDDKDDYEGFSIFQNWIVKSGKHISVIFLNDSINGFSDIIKDSKVNILALEDNRLTNKLVPQLIFGGIDANGKLAMRKGDLLIGGIGMDVNNINRFSYTMPEAVGLSSTKLQKIDSIAVGAMQASAMPGCQILVAKNNKVIYQKSFGFHTYDSIRRVSDSDLYDLASLTKVSGALPALMKLYEEGKFDLDATMGTYLPYFKKGNKKELTYREILAHQSGLKPYIVYWQTAIKKNGKYKRKTLSNEESENYNYELSPGLYLHKDYKKKIYKQVKKSKLEEKKYSYSGLTFLLYPEIIETISGQSYESYLRENFYDPLGANSLTYSPLHKFCIESIVPTEYDSLFRKTQIHGKVHDEAAAVMKGVSSNAGLFANANDLAKLFQMYCNYGTYGNKEYLNEETLLEFSRCQYPENDNRRGLGFDRPLPEPHENGNTAKSVSQLSFGHSGFTGTFAWVDPEYNLVYIFLSNRVYPTRENRKLYQMNVRTNIQEVIYEAIETY